MPFDPIQIEKKGAKKPSRPASAPVMAAAESMPTKSFLDILNRGQRATQEKLAELFARGKYFVELPEAEIIAADFLKFSEFTTQNLLKWFIGWQSFLKADLAVLEVDKKLENSYAPYLEIIVAHLKQNLADRLRVLIEARKENDKKPAELAALLSSMIGSAVFFLDNHLVLVLLSS